jgi:hypothetical protein
LHSRPDILRKAFLLFVVCASLAAVLIDLIARIQSWNPDNLINDPVTNWERRIEPLKADLPKNGEIGYLSDWDLPGWSGGQSDMDNEYRLTQYALAPRLLVRGSDYAQIVANLTKPEDVQRIEELYNVRKIHEYGLGIYLFEGPGR